MTQNKYITTPHEQNTFNDGLEYQDFIMTEFAKHGIVIQFYSSKKYQYNYGEGPTGHEIKLDNRCTDTNRLSIEVAERANKYVPVWTPSGVRRNDNSIWYIQGNYNVCFLFRKDILLDWVNSHTNEPLEFNGTVRRYFLNFPEAEKLATYVMRFK